MIRIPNISFLIGKGITEKMNELRVGGLVRLIKPENKDYYPEVRVYFTNDGSEDEGYDLTAGYLPLNSIGIIVKRMYDGAGYHVLVGERTIFVSDTYIEPYDGTGIIFMQYENDAEDISDMGATE